MMWVTFVPAEGKIKLKVVLKSALIPVKKGVWACKQIAAIYIQTS